jgi:Tfp pilus assembly protein PilN
MIRINLLPLAQRKSTFRIGLLYTVIIGSVLFVYGFIYAYYAVKIIALENELAISRQQYELARPTQEKMLLANQKIQQMAGKETVLNNLSKERSSWASLLSHLSGIMIPEVWFTEITGDKGLLHIKGGSADYAYIAKFLTQLDQDPLLSEPTLVNAETDGKQPATKFEITVKLKGL